MKLSFKLYYWPILTSLWFSVTFLVTYAFAVAENHVYPFFPYISDAGSTPPESCLFAQLMNLGAIFMLINIFLRYKYVEICNIINYRKKIRFWNNISIYVGFSACLGISIVGNFQESIILSVHLIGAFKIFFLGGIHIFIQTYLTWFRKDQRKLRVTRLILAFMFMLFFLSTSIFTYIAFKEFDYKSFYEIFHWTSDFPGYYMRVAATVSEWLMTATILIYNITYSLELKHMELEEIKFTYTESH